MSLIDENPGYLVTSLGLVTRRWSDEAQIFVSGTTPELVAIYVRPNNPRRFGFESAMWTLSQGRPADLCFHIGDWVNDLQVQIGLDGKVSKLNPESELL